MSIAFNRNLTATDATWIIETSSDLINWSAVTQATSTGAWSAPVSGTISQDEDGAVSFSDGVVPGAATRRFLRVRVVVP